ncbi:MAG TPA: methyltransferase domain-containing protein [Trinickia sp.]|nr:methyltransferase domain-containing protein [Trinickia sp.]
MKRAAGSQPAFAASVPRAYDEFSAPLNFTPFARDVAKRIKGVVASGRVLELAAGTGIATRALRDALPADVAIVATDLSEAMLAVAKEKFAAAERVEWAVVDATHLPFEDASFEAIVCQFGMMFFPDKAGALRECRRALKPDGTLLFNVWDALAHNDAWRLAHETIGAHFPQDPPNFYETPFGFHDVARIRTMLLDAGFDAVSASVVNGDGQSPSAVALARGLTEGSPVSLQIRERDESALPRIRDAIARELRERYGSGPISPRTQAIVFTARAR